MVQENVQDSATTDAPTKEAIINFFQEQIDVKKVQYELQELNTKLAVARAEELKALSFVAQMTNPKSEGNPYEGGVPHTITEEDMELNPELKEQGLNVGDEVLIPESMKEEEKASKKRGLKTK
jgi:hypothetical protein